MNKKLPILETRRLRLRPFRADDFDNLRLIDSNPVVMKYLGAGVPRSEDRTRDLLNKHLNDYEKLGFGLYAVEDKDTEEFMGRAGLIPWELEGSLEWEIGYTFLEPFWGKGYASEVAIFMRDWAKNNLDRDYVISLIHPENKASIRVTEKSGSYFWKEVTINGHHALTYRYDL